MQIFGLIRSQWIGILNKNEKLQYIVRVKWKMHVHYALEKCPGDALNSQFSYVPVQSLVLVYSSVGLFDIFFHYVSILWSAAHCVVCV